MYKLKPKHKVCRKCVQKRAVRQAIIVNTGRFGSLSHNWLGGRRVNTTEGYIEIYVLPDNFFRPMAKKSGYVAEHRLVMAEYLKRCLFSWEVVHHRNGIKNDNRVKNLELLPHSKYHLVDSNNKSRIVMLEKRVVLLEAEIILLKSQIPNQIPEQVPPERFTRG